MPPAPARARTPSEQRPRRPAPPHLHPLLGGRSVRTFLRQSWQKEALLVRGALPGFAGLFRLADLFALATREDVESRLVQRSGGRWILQHGPFQQRDLRSLPERNWTLLVQGVNLHVRQADALLRRFAFLPYARLDDLMVSYAAPGGGVGAHLDAYDVFLLQGPGRRRWRYGRQDDHAMKTGLPLRILRRFAPTHDEVLQAGDLLYLPPEYAHDGVALDACTTYSIGFRAPSANELATAFLDYLRDAIALPGRYADPNLTATDEPARISAPMQRKSARMLRDVRWNDATVAHFLGSWLSEPKPTVFFEAPSRPLSASAFRKYGAQVGVRLNTRSQLLYDDIYLFMNGGAVVWPAGSRVALSKLGNERGLSGEWVARFAGAGATLLYEWYCHGYLQLGA